MTPKKLNHIQVLRAISVLLVFFYHLENGIFQNGYLGVDIFFVISGMVITLKLYETYVKTNKINIKKFFRKKNKKNISSFNIFSFNYFVNGCNFFTVTHSCI